MNLEQINEKIQAAKVWTDENFCSDFDFPEDDIVDLGHFNCCAYIFKKIAERTNVEIDLWGDGNNSLSIGDSDYKLIYSCLGKETITCLFKSEYVKLTENYSYLEIDEFIEDVVKHLNGDN